jgi:hypothetical protein
MIGWTATATAVIWLTAICDVALAHSSGRA